MKQEIIKRIDSAWDDCIEIENFTKRELIEIYPNSLIVGDDKLGDFGIVKIIGNTAYISFRGSDDKQDWLSNLGLFTDGKPWWKCIFDIHNLFKGLIDREGYHRGFNKTSGKYFTDILRYLKNNNVTHVNLKGHSRGGGIVLLLGNKLLCHNFTVLVTTFGTPKVCTKSSTLYDNTKRGLIDILMVRNGMDIVPRLPFEFPMSNQLVYVGTQINIGDKLTVPETVKMMYYAICGRGKYEHFNDHRKSEYDTSVSDITVNLKGV